MSARVIDFERAVRTLKANIYVRAILAYNMAQKNGYTPADVVRAAPSWTYAMWTMLAAYASEIEGKRVAFPSPMTQAEVIGQFEKLADAVTKTKLLMRVSR